MVVAGLGYCSSGTFRAMNPEWKDLGEGWVENIRSFDSHAQNRRVLTQDDNCKQ